MNKFKIALIAILSIAFLSVSAWFLIKSFKPKMGGVFIDSTPTSQVYVNNNFVGKTPYEASFKPGEIKIKLVPQEEGYSSYETEAEISAEVKTVVRRDFNLEESSSSGYIVRLEKANKNETGIVVITTPSNAQVVIDGIPKGFTPYKVNSVLKGEHVVAIKSIGFKDRQLTVNLVEGYRLTIVSDLMKDTAPVKPEVASVKSEIKTFVEIADTPTGFLRIRSDPGSVGKEIAQVSPGEKFLFLEEDEATGWYKIQYQGPSDGLPNGIVGWVSNEYSKKVEEEITPSL